MLGGGCARDQQAHQTHTPHLEKLPNPRGLQVLVLVFSHLLCFHEACELWGNSREAHNLGAAGFSSVELYFASGLTLGAALCAGGPTTPLSGFSFSRTSYRGWVWCWAWLAQGEILPNPWSPSCGERGLSLSFQGLSTGKRQAQLSTGLALSPLPGGELVSIPEPTHLLPLVTFEHSRCFEVGLPSGSRDFVICHNKQVSSAFWNVPARGHLISSPGVALTGCPARLAPSPLVLSSHSVF